MASSSLRNITVPLAGGQTATSQGLLMPKLKYRFRANFLNFGVSQNQVELTKQIADITRPSLNFNPFVIDLYNSKVNLIGKPEWQTVTINLRDDAQGLVSGMVQLRSADPMAAPRIVSNYLRDSHDVRVLVAGLRQLREIYDQPAFRSLVTGEEYFPGNGVIGDKALEAFARERGGTVYHPVGTCRMGADDLAVVDERLRVRGVDGLRVMDASVMPRLVSTNTNAAAIMIGEKGAAMVLEDAQRSAPSHALT